MPEWVAVVTGGTRGIGLGISESLVKRGASVAVSYRDNERAAEKARQRLESRLTGKQKILFLQGDAGSGRRGCSPPPRS